MVLLGVFLREAQPGRRRFHERPTHARAPGRRPLLALRTLKHSHQLVVLEVSGRGDDDIAACVRLPVVRRQYAPRHGRDHVRRPDHGTAERVPPEDRLREEVVHELLRRVLVHRDLLEHDLSLGVELLEEW